MWLYPPNGRLYLSQTPKHLMSYTMGKTWSNIFEKVFKELWKVYKCIKLGRVPEMDRVQWAGRRAWRGDRIVGSYLRRGQEEISIRWGRLGRRRKKPPGWWVFVVEISDLGCGSVLSVKLYYRTPKAFYSYHSNFKAKGPGFYQFAYRVFLLFQT